MQGLLEQAGYTVYRDEDSILNGELIPEEIVRLIENASYFLLFHSEASEQSAWVNWECGIATIRSQKKRFEFKLIRLDDTPPEAFNLNKRYDDLTDLLDKTDEEVSQKLLEILKNRSRQIILRLMLRISLAVVALLVLTTVGGSLWYQQSVSNNQLAWYQGSMAGDTIIAEASNEDLEVLVYDAQKVGRDLVVEMELVNAAEGVDLYLYSWPEFIDKNEKTHKARYLVQENEEMLLEGKRILVGEDLSKGDGSRRMKLYFPMSTTDQATLLIPYSHSWYGAGKTIEVALP